MKECGVPMQSLLRPLHEGKGRGKEGADVDGDAHLRREHIPLEEWGRTGRREEEKEACEERKEYRANGN